MLISALDGAPDRRGPQDRTMGGENSPVERASQEARKRDQLHSPFSRPGDYSGVAAPDPIPNSAVKRPSANGTSS